MRKNIIIIIFACVLICGCHRADGQLQEVETDETTHQVDSFISPELVWQDRKSTRLNSSHIEESRMPSSA